MLFMTHSVCPVSLAIAPIGDGPPDFGSRHALPVGFGRRSWTLVDDHTTRLSTLPSVCRDGVPVSFSPENRAHAMDGELTPVTAMLLGDGVA